MNQPNLQSLLRRTAVAIAATAASLIALPASAGLTMALPGSVVCTNPAITTQPDGSLMLTCASTSGGGGIPPPVTSGPDTFAISGPTSLGLNATGSASIVRSGTPSTGDVGINWAVIGACSEPTAVANGGQKVFHTATPSPQTLTLNTGGAGGTCTVLINVGYGSATTTVGSINIPVSASAPPPPPPPVGGTTTGGSGASYSYNTPITIATYVPGYTQLSVPQVSGCPTPDPTTRMAGAPYPNGPYIAQLVAPSATVVSFPLYGLGQFNRTSTQLAFGEVTGISPAVNTMDISISPCPGVIDMSVNDACNIHGIDVTNGLTFGWANSSFTASQNLMCFAPEDQQRFYNVRWNYGSQACGSGTCGWSLNAN